MVRFDLGNRDVSKAIRLLNDLYIPLMLKYEAVTIKDIARELSILTSTVSRALSDNYEISAKTKRLVLECAKKMNYRPNPIALSLRNKKSKSVGVVVCEIANSFFSEVVNGIESVAYSKGYNIIISQSNESYDRELNDLEYLASRSVDGIIMSVCATSPDHQHIKSLFERGLPFVFFDRVSNIVKTHTVTVDNLEGALKGTRHLIANGYKKIACIASNQSLKITQERVAGYRKALAENNIELAESYTEYCYSGGLDAEEMNAALDKIMSLPEKPDAIISMCDKTTLGCLKYFKKHNIKVWEDMGLLGFFNSDLGEIFNPSLSVIKQPGFEMGKQAMEQMLNIIESKKPVTEFVDKTLSSELLFRESSNPAHHQTI